MGAEEFAFGPFRIDLRNGLLWRSGALVPLPRKAGELLVVLVREGQRGISKEQLLEQLWPDTVVAENNLTVTMSVLRKALGETAARPRFIQTLPRRGYRFVPEDPSAAPAPEAAAAGSVPPSGGRVRPRPREPLSAAAASEPEAPFVGREAELEFLLRRYERAIAGSGRVVLVSGEPGIGKTSLTERFLSALAGGGHSVLVARGRCLETFGAGEAYLPFLELLDGLLGGGEGARVQRLLRDVAPTWCLQFPAVFGSLETARALQRETVGATRERMLREWADALTALARERPLVLVLEDLHWADPSSVDLLRLMCQRSREHAWLLVCTLRRAEAALRNPPLEKLLLELGGRECDELGLGPLAERHVRSYLDERFGAGDLPGEMPALLFQKTEGHPLFLTRLVSLFVERADIVETHGGWALSRPLAELELGVPLDVRGAIRRQLELLQPPERRALAFASIEGEQFSSAVLAALLEEDELALQERLDPLCRVHRLIEVLGEERWPDGHLTLRYRFAHALYQNVLYEDLVSLRRARLHQQAAETLLAHFGERAALVAVPLSVHFERGRDARRAVEFSFLAGQKAHELRADQEANEHYSHALGMIDQLDPSERAAWAARLHLERGWTDGDRGLGDRGEADFHAALVQARLAKQPRLEADAVFACSVAAYFDYRLEPSRELDLELLRLAQASGEPESIARALLSLAAGDVVQNDLAEAARRIEHAERLLQPGFAPVVFAMRHETQGNCHLLASRYAAAHECFEQGLALWLDLSGLVAIDHYQSLGRVRGNLGRLSAALSAYGEATRLARRNGQEFHLLRRPSGVGWVLRELAAVPAALRFDREALALAQARGARFTELCHWIELGCDHTRAGDLDAAEEALRAARQGLEGPVPAFPCQIAGAKLRLLAAESACQRSRGARAAAGHSARQLLEAAARAGSPKYVAIAHFELAALARAEGNLAAARGELAAALRQLESHPVPIVAWRVWAELGRVEAALGNGAAAHQSFAAAAEIVQVLVEGVEDAELRRGFSTSSEVREVLAGAHRQLRGAPVPAAAG